MTRNSQCSSKSKVDESNVSKKKLVNCTQSTSSGHGTSDMPGLRRSVKDSPSNKQMPASPQSTRKSGRLENRTPVSPVIDRKSGGPDFDQTKVKREKSLNQLTLEVSISGDMKPACGKRKALDARSFKALYKRHGSKNAAADLDKNGINSSDRDDITEETLANAEKLPVDCSREEQLQTPEVAGSDLIGESHDDGIHIVSATTLSKRKRDFIMDLDVSAIDARKDACTSSSNDLHSSSGCKNHNVFETCATCSKRQRVDHDAHIQGFCSCSEVSAEDSHETDVVEDTRQLEASAPTEFSEKCDSRAQLKEVVQEIQTEATESRCVICKLGGKLMFCDGKDCQTSCHPTCLDSSTDHAPAGVWHCFRCLNNKMQAGACSLSESVEAIWNARETVASDAEGLRKDKQYFVKYKGRAHIHNQWIPESQLLLEAEELIEEYNKKKEAVKWNEEWVVPQRLVKKRMLSSPKQESAAAAGTTSSYCEWLVKWRGLDYGSVTWELDTFLSSVHDHNLIKDYENRHRKTLDDPSLVDKDRNGSLVKLQKFPAGSPPGLGTSHLETLNKLLEFRNKGQSAVVFDDQDRITKMLLYIVSLSDVCQPFLIVTTSSLLPVWEAEFLRAAPSIDVVVYDGSSDNRKSIRKLERYDDGGRIMLQVLLSSVEIVVEDLLFLKCMKWKVVIVDECQQPKILSQFEQVKMLAADQKILLYRDPLKDNFTEYFNLLSLLDSCGESINIDVPKAESSDNLRKLRERLSQYIACECKSSSSKFVEFWVPSMISNVQLEQYCDILLSKSISLCLYSKSDPVGALRDIVFSTRKSCDHPYIVDPSLKILITKDLPPINFLDVEIKASGKLQLLEMILSEIKKRQLRVLILFQSVAGSGRDTLGLGDILDDFLRERFGVDTFERVDGAISSKSRQTALNNFNKGSGRFVFLLEKRACLPSIKLVSVDTIIIFDSDWNPANDVKALNKISIDLQFKQMKIFRLYSAFTVEEKVLILAKQGLTLESNLENISRATSNTLLMWGASYLLNSLDKFHSTLDANVATEQTLSSKVVDQILALLSQNGECDGDNCSILKIQQRGGIYSSNLKLLGEQQVQLCNGEHPHIFWTNLLKERNPKWKFLSGQTQRHRKKVQYSDDSPKKAESEAVEVGKKRKKGGANCINPTNLNPGFEQDKVEGGACGSPGNYGLCCLKRPDASATNILYTSNAPINVSEKCTLSDAQKSLHLLLKPDALKLCEILKLSDEVKIMVERFLEYVISNHQVKNDSENLLQAFLISLCWSSASLLKQKVDRKESLFLAKQHLKYSCNENEAESVYFALRKLKKTFKENLLSDFSKDSVSGPEKFRKGTLNEKMSQLQDVKPELEVIRDQKKLIQKNCRKRIAKLKQKQEEEIKELNRSWEVQRVEIENKKKVESALIREMYSLNPSRMDKLKTLDNECAKKVEEFECQKKTSLEELKAKQLDALLDESRKVAQWLKSARSFATEVPGQDELPLHRSGIQYEAGYSQAGEHGSPTVTENDATLHKHPDDFAGDINIVNMVPHNTYVTGPNQDARCNSLNEIVTIPENPKSKDVEVENMASVNVPGLIEEVIRDANSLELGTPAVEYHAENERDAPQSAEAFQLSENATVLSGRAFLPTDQNVEENYPTDDGEMHLANKQPEISQQMVEHTAELPNQVLPHLGATDVIEIPLQQNQPDFPSTSTLDHQPLILNTSFSKTMAVPQITERMTELHRQADISTGVNMSIVQGFNELSLPSEHQVPSGIPKLTSYSDSLQNELEGIRKETEHAMKHQEDATAELPNLVFPHLGANVELHPPTDVIEIPFQQSQPDFPSTSTLDHPPLILNTYFLNTMVVPQITESMTELPRQADISTGVNMSIGQGFNELSLRAEHQVPSRIPKLTSYSDPLDNELEGIHKETEQAMKLQEDAKMRLKSELEEKIAQLHREYEVKLKDVEAAFLLKKKELDKNHNKVLVNKRLANAFRSMCMEPSRYTWMQQVVQHPNQLPSHTAPRSLPFAVTSSAYQPAAYQQNAAPGMSQPTSRLHPIDVSSTARQPATSQQNMTVPSQHGTRLSPVTSYSGSQPASKLQRTTLLMQPEPGNNFVSVSSSAGQPPASQRNTSPLLQPSLKISPVSASSSPAHSAASQQSTPPPLQIVHQSAALFSSILTRPPQINPINPSKGNLRVGNENRARAPAPHLQALRSASSVNLTPVQRVMPSHLTGSLPTSSSYPIPHAPPCPAVPSNYSRAIYSRPSPSNTAKDMSPPGLSTPTSASASHQELLKDSQKQHGAHRLNDDPPLPDIGSNLDSIDLTVFETGPSLTPSSAAADVTTNVVCLSDED